MAFSGEIFRNFIEYYKNGSIKDSILTQFDQSCAKIAAENCSSDYCRKRPIYRFVINVDSTADVVAFSPDLYEHIVYDPLAAQSSLRFAIFGILNKYRYPSSTTRIVNIDEIYAVLRLKFLPLVKGLLIEKRSDFSNDLNKPTQLITLGYAVSLTLTSTYIWSAQYFCTGNNCPRQNVNSLIRYHVAIGLFVSSVVDAKCTCDECGAIMVEDKPCRMSGTFQLLRLIAKEFFENPKQNNAQTITVILRDELCDSIELGKPYRIIGLPVYEMVNKNSVLKNIEACYVSLSDGLNERILMAGNSNYLNIENLLKNCATISPYRSPLTLAYHFADTVCPPGTYFKLKLLILMSLTSRNADRRLHLLAASQNSDFVLRLFRYARKFAKFSTDNSTLSNLLPVIKHDLNKNICEIQCGVLLAANDGVCVANLNLISNLEKQRLLKTMELDKTIVELPRLFGVLGSAKEFPFTATVWANGDMSKQQISDFQSPFGFVIETDFSCKDAQKYFNRKMVAFVASRYTVGYVNEKPQFSDEEWLNFVNAARNMEPVMLKTAQNLLESYYLTSRKIRENEFPSKSNKILLNFAIALAKLSLSEQVSESHALLAIKLLEEFSVGGCHGNQSENVISQLGVIPAPHFYTDDPDDYIGAKNDALMINFENTLKHFVKSTLKSPTKSTKVVERMPLANNSTFTNSVDVDVSFCDF